MFSCVSVHCSDNCAWHEGSHQQPDAVLQEEPAALQWQDIRTSGGGDGGCHYREPYLPGTHTHTHSSLATGQSWLLALCSGVSGGNYSNRKQLYCLKVKEVKEC